MEGTKSKCYGCFFGGIVGDALGAPVEFETRDTFPLVDDMNNFNFNFGLQAGGWTDDTSMTLCLAQSIIDCKTIDKQDNLEKYSRWYRHGYMSSKDYCFDIGAQTKYSILSYTQHKTIICPLSERKHSGNGGIMRISPVPIFYHKKKIQYCINACEESSITTHSSKICRDSAKYIGCILHLLINGITRDKVIKKAQKYFKRSELCSEILDIYDGKYLVKERKDISSSGYVIHTLEASLYSFFKFDTFEESLLFSVNLGDDADTVGCVTGMICGAYYGINTIPKKWLDTLHKKELLQCVIDNLYKTQQSLKLSLRL